MEWRRDPRTCRVTEQLTGSPLTCYVLNTERAEELLGGGVLHGDVMTSLSKLLYGKCQIFTIMEVKVGGTAQG